MKHLSSIRTIFLMCLFLGMVGDSFGQLFKKNKKEPDYGFHIKAKRGSYTLPFKVYSNLIVIPVTIDGSDTLNFILDTGVSSNFIVDPKVGEALGLEYQRTVAISGAGEGEALRAYVSVGHEFKVGNITGYRQNVVVLSEDILHLSEFMGVQIHGIFGHAMFEHFVITIDFNSLVLNIRRPEKFRYSKRYGDKYPIVVTQSKPYTDAITITEANDQARKVRLVIDTGAGHALLLNSEEGHIELPQKVIRANLGRGLNGEIYGNIGRVSKVSIGKYQMNDVIASFPDSLTFSMKFPPTEVNRQGSIGGEFLRRFKVTLNYREGYMALKPNKTRLKQPFEHDMSGLDVRADKEDFTRFYVSEVVPNSPASGAGLEAKDEIVFINNQQAFKMSVAEIYRLLSKKEGKTIEVFYRRNGALRFASFVLKRVI
ncbi:MAG: putative aspartyl protease [Arcticibacterium sp.]|jgi:predicted aspartyl protease